MFGAVTKGYIKNSGLPYYGHPFIIHHPNTHSPIEYTSCILENEKHVLSYRIIVIEAALQEEQQANKRCAIFEVTVQ